MRLSSTSGTATDGTFETIASIDPKIQVTSLRVGPVRPERLARAFKNQARKLCSGDWCVAPRLATSIIPGTWGVRIA
jgi:hypothetical protein